MHATPPSSENPALGWVLYDRDCGVCRGVVEKSGSVLKRQGFAIRPLQDAWVRERIPLPEAELLKDLRLLLNDGRQFAGADAYRFVMRRIWWAWPFYLLSILPGLHALFNWSYRTFADNRHRISKSCRLS